MRARRRWVSGWRIQSVSCSSVRLWRRARRRRESSESSSSVWSEAVRNERRRASESDSERRGRESDEDAGVVGWVFCWACALCGSRVGGGGRREEPSPCPLPQAGEGGAGSARSRSCVVNMSSFEQRLGTAQEVLAAVRCNCAWRGEMRGYVRDFAHVGA